MPGTAAPTATGPPIVQYWHEDRPPAYIAELVESVRAGNPMLRHLLFTESTAEAFIAERFGERELRAFRACAVPAMQSDYLRYCAVLALGGVYVDADFRCAAALDPLLNGAGAGALFRRPRKLRVGGHAFTHVLNGLFAFRAPGHPLLELALAVATANVERRVSENVWVTTGPGIFSALLLIRDLGSIDTYEEMASAGAGEDGRRVAAALRGAIGGDHRRVVDAFSGVRVLPFEASRDWVGSAGPLPYKETEAHWLNVTSSIFR